MKLKPGPRNSTPMLTNVAKKHTKIVNRVMASFRSSGLVEGLRSMNGAASSPRMIHCGIVTPATWGWKYRRSSCRPRKYQGALEGFGVWLMLASSRNGALITTETTTRKAVAARIASISDAMRWGQTLTRSIGSFSTRWIASGLTTARSRWMRSGTASVLAARAARAAAPRPLATGAGDAAAAAATLALTGTAAAAGAAGAAVVPFWARIRAALARAWATTGEEPLACSSASTRSKTASGDSPPLDDTAAAAGAGVLAAAAGAGASPPEGCGGEGGE